MVGDTGGVDLGDTEATAVSPYCVMELRSFWYMVQLVH